MTEECRIKYDITEATQVLIPKKQQRLKTGHTKIVVCLVVKYFFCCALERIFERFRKNFTRPGEREIWNLSDDVSAF